jgi:hypothetical protein
LIHWHALSMKDWENFMWTGHFSKLPALIFNEFQTLYIIIDDFVVICLYMQSCMHIHWHPYMDVYMYTTHTCKYNINVYLKW